MAELRASLEAAGLSGAKTYLQSGNVVFRSRAAASTLSKRLQRLLHDDFALEPDLLLLKHRELQQAVAHCPYVDHAQADPRRVHLYFLSQAPQRAALDALRAQAGADRFERVDRVIYLHTPGGYGKSKLAAALLDRKKLGVTMTARNYRTAQAVEALAAEMS